MTMLKTGRPSAVLSAVLLLWLTACSAPDQSMTEPEPVDEEAREPTPEEYEAERAREERLAAERKRSDEMRAAQQAAERARMEEYQRQMEEAATSTASINTESEEPGGSAGGATPEEYAAAIEIPDVQYEVPAPVIDPYPMPAPEPVSPYGLTDPVADEFGFSLPEFPWPPEQPSSRMRVDRGLLISEGEETSLAEVEERLTEALASAGYFEQSFYSVPGGFALVTRLEGIDPDGRPLKDELRYVLSDDKRPFSLSDFVGSLFFAPEGNYRFVTFIVSDVPFMTSAESLTEELAITRLQEGASDLPAGFADIPASDDLKVEALIYEYKKTARQASPELIRPGRLAPNTHMTNSGIMTALDAMSPRRN